MTLALPLSAKLVVAVAAVGGIGVVALPADLNLVDGFSPAQVIANPGASVTVASLSAKPSIPAWVDREPTPSASLEKASDGTPTAISQVKQSAAGEERTLRRDHVNASVNVRAEGRKGAPVLFVLAAGVSVSIAGSANGWSHVYSDQGEGWVYSKFIGDTKKQAPPDRAKLSVKTVRVSTNVPVYNAPAGSRLYRLEAGEQIRLLETKGKWARIATSTGDGGWVRLN